MSVLLVGLGLLVVGILAAIGVVLSRNFYRVVRGDPLDVRWRLEADGPALVLELSMVGRAEPLLVEGLEVQRRLVDLLELDPPPGFVRAEPSGQGSESSGAGDRVEYAGSRAVDRGEVVELRLPMERRLAAEGVIAVSYRYRSILARMSGVAMARVSVPAPGSGFR